MKSNLIALILSILAVSAFAGEAKFIPVPTAAGAPQTVAEAMALLRANRSATPSTPKSRLGRVRANVIELETQDNAFLIPAAGSVQGSNGTFFRSDVTFFNNGAATQNIGVAFLVAGQDNTNAPMTHFTIDPGVVTINDFVATTMKTSGLGSLLVTAFDSTGMTPDSNALIDGFSRIWTPQPGSSGTVSQSFPSASLFDSVDDFTAIALGLRQDSGFRTNVGVVNLDKAAHTWTITSVNTGATMQLTVQPFSLSQTGVPANFAGTGGNLSMTYDVSGTGFSWSAYASSVDNVTGDGWVARANQ